MERSSSPPTCNDSPGKRVAVPSYHATTTLPYLGSHENYSQNVRDGLKNVLNAINEKLGVERLA